MKKLIIVFAVAISLLWQGASSQNLIAVQNGGTPSFFTQVTTAIEEANGGDTIYIPGYIYSIGDVMGINKELHIIGIGHNPDSTLSTGFTQLNGNFYLSEGSSNGSIEGIFLNGRINFQSSSQYPSIVNGFSIARNNLTEIYFVIDGSQVRYTNNSIIENIIRNGITTNMNGASDDIQSNLISNNIIPFNISGLGYNNAIRNNIIGGKANLNTISNLNGCLLENNILLDVNSGGPTISNSTFKNNLSLTSIFLYNLSGTNVFSNNITDALDNLFVNYPTLSDTYSYDFDFHLLQTSPGKNAGRDGTDIGIYGGTFPWKEGSIPFNPHFQSIQIAPTTDSIGNLNVNIKVAAQDH